ncbi:MAG: hypothetical protein PHE25_02185, partial [Candidatus Gracilibacteria bacterium]|nr:hypothetical protein [Candidatus Gracilibacteria bacterium]
NFSYSYNKSLSQMIEKKGDFISRLNQKSVGFGDDFTNISNANKSIALTLNNGTISETLSGNINVASGFTLVGETAPNEVFSFSGSDVASVLSGALSTNFGSQNIKVDLQNDTKLFSSTGNINFENKIIPTEVKVIGTEKQSILQAVKVGADNSTIILNKPAILTFLNSSGATNVGYRKSGTTNWILIPIQDNECNVDLVSNQVCAYKSGNNVIIKTYHFTDFSIIKVENLNQSSTITKSSSSGGGGGGGGGISSITDNNIVIQTKINSNNNNINAYNNIVIYKAKKDDYIKVFSITNKIISIISKNNKNIIYKKRGLLRVINHLNELNFGQGTKKEVIKNLLKENLLKKVSKL